MDRALFSSIWRKQKQMLSHHKLAVESDMSVEEVNLLNLKSWNVATGCAAHDANKSLQWKNRLGMLLVRQ
eukprot:6137906-Amphidinium_carterae.3